MQISIRTGSASNSRKIGSISLQSHCCECLFPPMQCGDHFLCCVMRCFSVLGNIDYAPEVHVHVWSPTVLGEDRLAGIAPYQHENPPPFPRHAVADCGSYVALTWRWNALALGPTGLSRSMANPT